MRTRDDGQVRIDARLQRCADLANALVDTDQVGGLAAKLRRQQGVLERQGGHASTLQFDHRAHHIERVAITVVGIGDDGQARYPANARGLFDELAKGDQGEVRCSQNL